MKDGFINIVKSLIPKVDYCSFRFVNKYTNVISATRSVVEPVTISEDDGLMVTIFNKGGYGYGVPLDDGSAHALYRPQAALETTL